jgi:DNA-binding NtrC family response regulator
MACNRRSSEIFFVLNPLPKYMIGESHDFTRALIGQSPRMRQVHRQIEKLAKTRWPVLILGETGTGKEVVARCVHSASPAAPFVTVDCSALVAPLMESELFGYAKGAFTGAVASKLGMIEMANGGTVFLDEIGELPLEMQVKLLRVLQEKEFRPVGSLVARKVDFRVIAATNRDLAKEVERGTFRSDLFYRINVVTLRLTPLRERTEDILPLLQHFLARYGRNHSLTQETLDAMLAYEWPGNVRELENCVQHMVALNSGPLLHLPDLPSMIQNRVIAERPQLLSMTMAMSNGRQPGAAAPRTADEHILPLPEVEKRAILEALRATKGDRGTAAALLGIGRTTLYRKLKEYGLEH